MRSFTRDRDRASRVFWIETLFFLVRRTGGVSESGPFLVRHLLLVHQNRESCMRPSTHQQQHQQQQQQQQYNNNNNIRTTTTTTIEQQQQQYNNYNYYYHYFYYKQ